MFILVNSQKEVEKFHLLFPIGTTNLVPIVRSHRFDHIKSSSNNLHLKIYEIYYHLETSSQIANFLYEDITSSGDVRGLIDRFRYEKGNFSIFSVKLDNIELLT